MRYLPALLAICFLLGASEGLIVDPAMRTAFPSGNPKDLALLPHGDVIHSEQSYVEPAPFKMLCPTLPAPSDTSDVNNLRPGNIKVIMSMGDSITAAMSAKDVLLIGLKEYRGISYAIGGDSNVTTMGNLLKHYTPNLIGQSTGTGLRTSAGTGFNAAVSGGLSVDMPGQAEWLVDTVKKHPKVNMANDWKVLTIWIGSNNLCAVCKNPQANDANDYEKRLTDALTYIQTNIPRVFVNLIAVLDVSKLNNFTGGTCGSLHVYECGCTSSNASYVAATAKEFQSRAYKIAAAFNAKKDPGFAVVVQPYLINSFIFDRSYLSTADCFHPSAICHKALSVALWNSMITPVADKKTKFEPDEPILCASADTLLYTK